MQLKFNRMNEKDIFNIIEQNKLTETNRLKAFVSINQAHYSIQQLSRIIELANTQREQHSAYYTNDFMIEKIINRLPEFTGKTEITIIEPSVGAGNFLPFLFQKYAHIPKVNLLLIDIDKQILSLLDILYQHHIPRNFHIQLIHHDFLDYDFEYADLIIGNPPFTKLKSNQLQSYLATPLFSGLDTDLDVHNLAGLFLAKAIKKADYISMIMPKNLLNTPEYGTLRNKISRLNVEEIIDFGELGFKGVLIETINIMIKNEKSTQKTQTCVISIPKKIELNQISYYIFDTKLPYWVIYRNDFFDNIFNKLTFDLFDVFRDRQITNSNTQTKKNSQSIRVLKSRNIDDTGENILNIPSYDAFIQPDILAKFSVAQYLNRDDVYLTPNMTYNPRVMQKTKGNIVNGSIAILIPKKKLKLNQKQIRYFASEEFRRFYRIARNHQTRSLNIDKNSVYWFGIFQERKKNG